MTGMKCSTCQKAFKRKSDLNRHENIHKGIKPHICRVCGIAFAQHCTLVTHGNTHTLSKPHKCGVNDCNAAFGDPSSCSRHRQEAHFHIGHYFCSFSGCSSRIKRRSAFVAHLKKHGIDPKTISIDSLHSFSRGQRITHKKTVAHDSPAISSRFQPNYMPDQHDTLTAEESQLVTTLKPILEDRSLFPSFLTPQMPSYDMHSRIPSLSPPQTISSSPTSPGLSYLPPQLVNEPSLEFYDFALIQPPQFDFLDGSIGSSPSGTGGYAMASEELFAWTIESFLTNQR